jgi:hypothetical protein
MLTDHGSKDDTGEIGSFAISHQVSPRGSSRRLRSVKTNPEFIAILLVVILSEYAGHLASAGILRLFCGAHFCRFQGL